MLGPECHQDNPPVRKFCSLCCVSAPAVPAPAVVASLVSLGAGMAVGRPEPDKHVLGLLQGLTAGWETRRRLRMRCWPSGTPFNSCAREAGPALEASDHLAP